ncbi:unnamed protein product [Mytilus coruscus]|uniref:Galaxin-like repeats domain-containing protein n=1 Tax=Mytilus coruscus TaxID=42192 RepID=A0A6J7ZWV6_MYTCO|nr:unnamed protein product [Mytilus coruscus]
MNIYCLLLVLTLVIVEVAAERCMSSREEYDSETQLCCDFGVTSKFNKHGQELDCCSEKRFIVDTEICCKKDVFKKLAEDGKELSCCGAIPYQNPEKVCCNNILHDKINEDCCGNGLYDSQYQSCCGSVIYNTSSHQCCQPGGDIIVKSCEYKCYGKANYDSHVDVCCTKHNFNGETFKIITKSVEYHDTCCVPTDLEKSQSYSSITHRCQLGGIINKTDMCGNDPYNETSDLCCDGVLDKMGLDEGRDCCGIKSYNKTTKICCDNTIYLKTNKQSCHQNTTEFIDEISATLPRHIDYGICSYCNLHSIENVKLFLESATNLCKRFVLKIANIYTSMAGNTTTVDGIIHLNDYSKLLRLGDSNLIIPWSKRASNYLQKRATQCVNDKNKFAMDTVAGIKISIEFTKPGLKGKGGYNNISN